MNVRSVVQLVLGVCFCVGMVDVRAGALVEFNVRVSDKGSSQFQEKNLELGVKDGVVWIGNTQFQNYLVYDSKAQTLAIVDHEKKQYVVLTESEIDHEIDEARRFAAMITSADLGELGTKDFSPEDIEKEFELKSKDEIDQILSQQGQTLTMTSTGESRKYSDGYVDMACQIYAVSLDIDDPQLLDNIQRNKQHKNQLCISNVESLDIPEEDWNTLRKFLQLAWRYMGRFPLPDVLGQILPNLGGEFIEGVPIHVDDNTEGSPPIMRVQLIQSAEIMNAALIPEDYQQVTSERKCITNCDSVSQESETTMQNVETPTTTTTPTHATGESNASPRKKRRVVTAQSKQQAAPIEEVTQAQPRKKRKVITSKNSSEEQSASASKKTPTQAVDAGAADCDYCPAMVAVPAGEFVMGKLAQESSAVEDTVTIQPFELSKYEITRKQYSAYIEDTGQEEELDCMTDAVVSFMADEILKGNFEPDVSHLATSWQQPGFEQEQDHPVVCVSWDDAEAYVSWLNEKTGQRYRLPSEAEWEYAARAGTDTAYFWGDAIGEGNANCADACGDEYEATAPVGALQANAFGLHDMHGNVYEWVKDDWLDDLKDAPKDGTAWSAGGGGKIIRGGGFDSRPLELASSFRWKIGDADVRSPGTGFRIARSTQ